MKNNSLFRLADALSARKKEQAWLLYQQELLSGTSPEDIFWKIWWQIKTLLKVQKGEKNFHPFVLKKAQKAISLFKKEELYKYSGQLVSLYHKNRLGQCDLETSLEKFILRI